MTKTEASYIHEGYDGAEWIALFLRTIYLHVEMAHEIVCARLQKGTWNCSFGQDLTGSIALNN